MIEAESERTLSLAVLSSTPLSAWAELTDDERNPMLVGSVDLASGRIRFLNVHLSAPRSGELIGRRQSELEYLATGAPTIADVVIGDFNSDPAHADFRALLGRRWSDASSEVGCGVGGTWSPLGRGPGLMSLDHVLVADDGSAPYRVVAVRLGDYAGSDHRGLVTAIESSP